MNQAALHKLLLSGKEEEKTGSLFEMRLHTNLNLIQELFFKLYPEETNIDQFTNLIGLLGKLHSRRPEYLKAQDKERITDINWYKSQKIVGMQLYVDLFDRDLKGLKERIPYLEELGVNLLHLMPITTRPERENDGGYAVNSYTDIDPKYGTQKDFEELTETMRSKDMYLMVDFVVNHTSDEHHWAMAAKEGNETYQAFYHTFANREIPDVFENSLQEVFPQTAPGNFTYVPEMGKWVMTVFNNYQWDLNYQNPEVFFEMLGNLSTLSNMGADIVRLDALAFLWKKLGTNSQNLVEAHILVSLFRLCLQVIAPGTILLAEAIVAPEEIIKYFGEGNRTGNECELAYNASLMSLLWDAIATKKSTLLYKTLFNLPQKPSSASWINYIRCHDDIGLGLSDRFIKEVGWNPRAHRSFLLDFYCQGLDWSPAKGVVFMFNPKTGDGRISGSAASLLGLEKGLDLDDVDLVRTAMDKIVMLHGIILSFGGIPMIYAGDEIGTLNDYTFLNDDGKKDDNRWINRVVRDWQSWDDDRSKKAPSKLLFDRIKELIKTRSATTVFGDYQPPLLHDTGNGHLFVFERTDNTDNGVLVIANFDENVQILDKNLLVQLGYVNSNIVFDLVSDKRKSIRDNDLEIEPYQLVWLKKIP